MRRAVRTFALSLVAMAVTTGGCGGSGAASRLMDRLAEDPMLEEDIGLDGLEPGELYRSNTGFSDEGVSVGRFHRGDLSLEDVRSAVIQRAEDAGWVIHSLSCGRTADVVFAQREIAGRPATLQVIASRTDDGTLVDVQVLSAVRGERLSADGDETPRRCD